MRSNDPNRRLLNFIYQRMEDKIASERWQAYLAALEGQAKVELLTQEILNDLERRRIRADLDSRMKEEEKQKKILRHQRLRRYVYKHASDYAYKHVNEYVHKNVNEIWDKYQTDEEFRKRVDESIERGLAALGRVYSSLRRTAVSETTGSPITDHSVSVSWDSEGKYTSGPDFQ